MRINKKTTFKTGIVFLLVLFVTLLHYLTRQEETFLHIIYRELYFLPIILAGFWFGVRGGLTTALIITSLYIPVVMGKATGFSEHNFGNLLEILLFNVIGILIGWLQEREILHQKRKREEEGLVVMGKAVACIAHDMKTPLITIGGFVRQIRRKLPQEDKTGRKLDFVVQQTERLELMVQDMLAFARPLELNRQDDKINNFLKETLLVTKEKAKKHNVHLSLQLQDNLPVCFYDFHRLQQALINLVNNGVEATPAGEEVIIRCKIDKDTLFLEVEDHGEGVSIDKMESMLQPFVSTKKEGTGLGLPIVKKITEAHGGVLQYEQSNKKGMIFKMLLPVMET